MDKKVKNFVKLWNDCKFFVDKKTQEPIRPYRVPDQSWETVAVDLFGPMPYLPHGNNYYTITYLLLENFVNRDFVLGPYMITERMVKIVLTLEILILSDYKNQSKVSSIRIQIRLFPQIISCGYA